MRGEIWLVSLPQLGGREQGGTRPAIVLQDSAYGQGSPLVILVPLTAQLAALRFPGTLQIEPTPSNGLTVPSVAMVFQVRALDRSRLVRRVGVIESASLDATFQTLDRLTGRA